MSHPTAATPPEWQLLLTIGDSHTVPGGTVLIEEGRDIAAACLLERGLVRLSFWHADRRVIVRWRSGFALLGCEALLSPRRAALSADACGACRVRYLPVPALRRLFEAHPLLVRQLLVHNSRELVDMVERLRDSVLPARRRLQRGLFELATQVGVPCGGRAVRLVLPLSWDDLARSVDITPQWQSRLLQSLEADGVVRREGGRSILIPNLDRLARDDERGHSETSFGAA